MTGADLHDAHMDVGAKLGRAFPYWRGIPHAIVQVYGAAILLTLIASIVEFLVTRMQGQFALHMLLADALGFAIVLFADVTAWLMCMLVILIVRWYFVRWYVTARQKRNRERAA